MLFIRAAFVLILSFFLFRTSYARINPLIVGGDYASIELYPHSAYISILRISKKNSSSRLKSACGASILNQDILLTAAHCVTREGYNTYKIFAIVGLSNISGVPKSKKHIVSSFIVHKTYGYKTKLGVYGDIALLKLKKSLKFGKRVKRVEIMKSPPYYAPASIAGWGTIDYNKTKTDMLKHLRGLKVWSREECLDHFDVKQRSNETIKMDSFCAGYSQFKNKPEHVFYGDSGSALLVRDYIQIGVAQSIWQLRATKNKRKREIIQVYTDVGFHYDWILKNVMKLYCGKSSSIQVPGKGGKNK